MYHPLPLSLFSQVLLLARMSPTLGDRGASSGERCPALLVLLRSHRHSAQQQKTCKGLEGVMQPACKSREQKAPVEHLHRNGTYSLAQAQLGNGQRFLSPPSARTL